MTTMILLWSLSTASAEKPQPTVTYEFDAICFAGKTGGVDCFDAHGGPVAPRIYTCDTNIRSSKKFHDCVLDALNGIGAEGWSLFGVGLMPELNTAYLIRRASTPR